jgi:CheY-like chemotaxis protein
VRFRTGQAEHAERAEIARNSPDEVYSPDMFEPSPARLAKRILVVDDDLVFRAKLEKLLSGHGYVVLSAEDGQEAIRILDQLGPQIDLVMADLALPRLNGFELIGNLSRNAHSLKIIAITGVYKQPFLDVTTTLGAHAALRKPDMDKPVPPEWLAIVDSMLAEGAASNC